MSLMPYALRGDARRADLDELQHRIDALLAEQASLQAAPMTLTEFKGRVAAGLGGWSGLRAALGTALRSRERQVTLDCNQPLTLADLAQILGTEALMERLEQAATGILERLPTPLSASECAARSAKIQQELKDLQAQEEREVLRLYDAGIKVTRRENGDAKTILKVWSEANA